MCRMIDKRLITTVVFGVMEGPNKPRKPKREWLEDIKEWRNMDIYSTGYFRAAQGREMWSAVVGAAVGTNGF